MEFILPDWDAPTHIKALTTTRAGGVSESPYAGLNLGDHVDDQPTSVAQNRSDLIQTLGLTRSPQWLNQVHGVDVVKAADNGAVPQADACWTDEACLACIVMTADCLPVFFTNADGSKVAVAHAGWRGLQQGVLEATLKIFSPGDRVLAWLGPAIGPDAFEVGAEVREAFVGLGDQFAEGFSEQDQHGKYLADLYHLARLKLTQAGVEHVFGGQYCTYNDPERFYSYRRDGQTGRMASLIWIEERQVVDCE
ncbi:peptidoglycan editing factor PgeF [Neptuniibacter sp. CAU 1671]|uniref:peptidoglycan editing factor PgeF n=1 Tax=Neptuniibacter sp. CAU 1671 TaxID=3032593 RepID=UPI0023DAFA21|nr:peptidoglycan editing factor PgeF [Neptuniibacter sp. CAU 1671]MDF2182322.1 peptidoglycan editing factor PgeF [Neptuniibacter sp. CAU 1671]